MAFGIYVIGREAGARVDEEKDPGSWILGPRTWKLVMMVKEYYLQYCIKKKQTIAVISHRKEYPNGSEFAVFEILKVPPICQNPVDDLQQFC